MYMIFMRRISQYSKHATIYMMWLSLVLVLFGILLILMPELLAYFISFLLILAGVILFFMALRIKQIEQKVTGRVEEVSENIKNSVDNIHDTFRSF